MAKRRNHVVIITENGVRTVLKNDLGQRVRRDVGQYIAALERDEAVLRNQLGPRQQEHLEHVQTNLAYARDHQRIPKRKRGIEG